MTRVIADITISLDGYVTGPDPGPDSGLGRGGEPLHTWVMEPDEVDEDVLRTATEASGAVVMGRHLFDVVDGPHGWSDEMGYGAHHAGTPPFFVVTHEPPTSVRLALDFSFDDDLATAVERARAAAGERDVVVMGGGQVVDACLRDGIADELVLHVSPLILRAGTPLFGPSGPPRSLTCTAVRPSRNAVHLRYDVGGPLPA